MAIEILAAPNLRTSYMKTVERLKELNYDTLFLNLPENLEPLVRDLAQLRLPYKAFVGEVRQRTLVPWPINGWRYTAEPLLKSLADLKSRKPELEICCYRDAYYDRLSANTASEVARLTLRASIKRGINIEDWKNILIEEVNHRREALDREVDSIHEKTSRECNCVSGLDGENLERRLREKGQSVKLTNIEKFYHPTPLEILEERLAKGDILDEEAEELVKDHLEYVKNYILLSKNRDQAYYQWVYDKVPSLRPKIDSEEIRHLDALLNPDDV